MARWSILSNRFSGPRGGSPLEGLSDVHRSQESGFGIGLAPLFTGLFYVKILLLHL